ncbi:sugar phosphate nucleotidyltransferase [Oscillatoria sp. FACHB-1406]|uniref:sugar phosphate nucleotidyltransferase n=1 Tax=Oscillatoria sp. FACHB-1406 TaxID=2692846 RepID=UPI0018EF698D|nr:sugar phosphate nucleotidyltransferase [Oscillatoria sp. FACHB-1406]
MEIQQLSASGEQNRRPLTEIKGIILAGGQGSRLEPLTEVTNKHLLPVGREPMIWHPVKQLVSAGVRDILVVTSTNHMGDVVNSLGSGRRMGCEFTYRVQEQPQGIADALSLAETFASGKKIVVLLGDNIFEYSIRPHLESFLQQEKGARILLKEVGDPERFAVAALDEQRILEIEEKPANPKTNYAVVGCYMYDEQVFDIIRTLQPSGRGEYEITSVNDVYRQRQQLEFSFVRGRWADAGTFESLNEANQMLLSVRNQILTE